MLKVLGIVLLVAAAIGLGAGVIILEGWLIFLIYNAIAPESWVYLGLWPAVGIAFVLSMIFGGGGASARAS